MRQKTNTLYSRAAVMLLTVLMAFAGAQTARADGLSGMGTVTNPYLITSAADWTTFANAVSGGTTYEGETLKLTADINGITTMAGTSDNRFKGTFMGDGHTLTVNYTATANDCAPFLYIDGATINTLKVTGTISTGYKYAAGIAAHSYGTSTIKNCWSNVAISTTISGDGTHAGLVAVLESGGSLSIANCLFDGSITGGSTTNCGGLVGWRNATLTFNNCMMAGSMDISQTNGSALFNRNGSSTLTNCYYDGSKSYGSITAQGTSTTATGSDLQALLGAGWTVSGGKAVPIMDATNLATATISGIDARYYRTKGTELKPEPVITAADGKVLTKDQDYTVEWSGDGKTDGTYTVTVIGTGGYVGSWTFSYFVSIVPLWLSIDTSKQPGDEGYYYVNMNTSGTRECEIPDGFEEQFMVRWSHGYGEETGTMTLTVPSGRKMVYSGEWSGSQYHQDCTYSIKEGSTIIYEGYETKTLDKTTTTGNSLTITCMHDGTRGELTLYVNMKADPICISDLSEFYAYTGSTVSVTPTVRDANANKTLTAGTDYDLTFTPATVKDKGVYTATFSGKGAYSFTKTMNFLVGTLDYIDADGSTQSKTLSDITLLTNRDELPGTLTGWYIVADNISFNSRPSVSGTAHLILADGATMTSNYGCTVTDGNTLNIYGQAGGTGTLTVRANSGYAAIGGTSNNNGGTITINGGQVTATGGSGAKGFSTSGTITLSLRKTTDFITSNGYDGTVNIKSGLRLTDGTNFYSGNDVSIPNDATLRQANFTVNAAGTEYTIHNATGWDVFCDALQDNDTYNRFSGKTVKLGGDIGTAQNPITRMAGSQYHDFCGTFDGQGYTLTFNYGSAVSYGSDNYVAPFSYVSTTKADPNDENDSPAAFRNLHVCGDIYTSGIQAGGIVSREWGTVSITNCRSSVNIHSSHEDEGTHGGLVACVNNGSITIEGCLFDGRLLGASTSKCGGFIGWRGGTAEIRNSLYAPAEVTVSNEGSATFARNKVDCYNSYYTNAFYDATYAPYLDDGKVSPAKWNNGIAARSITAGENVTISNLALTGTPTEYNVSGITAYSDGGLTLDNGATLYYGSGDQVSLTLSNSATGAPLGYQYGYSASAGTISGYMLTMADANATVNVDTDVLLSTGQPVSVSYIDAAGTTDSHDAIALDETMTSLAANQWYFVGKDIDYTQTVTLGGDVTIILKDGYTMNVGTSSERISSGNCINGYNGWKYNSLTIYGQSDDPATAGTLNAYNSDSNTTVRVKNYTQHGGTVTIAPANATALYLGGDLTLTRGILIINSANYDAILTNNGHTVTVSGGTLSATSGCYAIRAALTMSGGNVTATGGNGAIFDATNVSGGTLTINGNIRGTVTIADGLVFTDGTNYYAGTLTADEKTAISGQTLTRLTALPLDDTDDNTAAIDKCNGATSLDITLQGRTLYKDGSWNTLFLPFTVDLTAEGCPLAGATVKKLTSSTSHLTGSTLTLNFEDETTTMTAGTPYIIKWTSGSNIVNPVFQGVTVDNTMHNVGFTGGSFRGTYSPVSRDVEDQSILFLGANNQLYWPDGKATTTIGACRAYFQLDDGQLYARQFVLNFGDGDASGIETMEEMSDVRCKMSDVWYSLDGRKLDGKPVQRGLYINNGRKVVIK